MNTDDYVEESSNTRDDSAEVQELIVTPEKKAVLRWKLAVKKLKHVSVFSRVKPATEALKGFNFVSKEDVVEQFDKLTIGTGGLLDRSLFGECIGMNNDSKEFAEDLFDSLCRRRNISNGSINKAQFKDFWVEISDKRFDSRLQIFLDMVDKDKDKDGKITEDELKEIIRVSASANKLSNIKTHAAKYATLIMEELDPSKPGYIKIEELGKLLKDAGTQNEKEKQETSISSKQHQKPIRRWYEDSKYYLQENWQKCWVIILWVGAMAGLFTWKYIQYKHRAIYEVLGACVSVAKGSAETLKLNMAIMLLLVCRNTITWLRNKTRLGLVVPFDDNITFHQVVAIAIAIGVGLHAISHLACDFPRLIHATEEEYKPMQQYFGDQPKNYGHFLKEVEGYTGITMVVLMTIAFTLAWLRQSKLKLPSFFDTLSKYKAFKNSKLYGAVVNKLTKFIEKLNKLTGFNVFWYSHHLFIIVYAMFIVHGIKLYLTKEWYKKTTWMYLAVPITLYACERFVRAFRSRFDSSRILKVTAYPGRPGGVLSLRMKKPDKFKYKSGQYMFVKCAAVSPFEWHPFSITSAPDDDYLSVHIRALGDWTKKINKIFSEVCPANEETGIRSADFPEENRNVPRVRVDGPYGAPAQDYKKYKVVLLVGLGIGATPMISIVKDIVNNMKAKEEEEHALENGDAIRTNKSSPKSENHFHTTRAYFYWVTKEQDSFDWFEGVINEVAKIDKSGIIEMHNYCTSVYEKGDARSALITMLQSLNHAKNGIDVVSGTRFKSHFGKPDWRDVYSQIAVNHKDPEIGVFYCGPEAAAKVVKNLAADFSHDKSTKFVFHKEIF